MTTVGYGDYHPVTAPGYIVGALCAVSGIIISALPVAIIGNNFSIYWQHNQKRKQLLKAKLESNSTMDME